MMLSFQGNTGKIIFKSDFLLIQWEAGIKLLAADWSGWLDSAKGREGCQQILEAVHELPVIKILNDNSKVIGHSGATDWLGQVWLPTLHRAGVLYFAWVYPKEFFTQLQIDKAIAKCEGLEVKAFFSADEARQWLNQHDV